MNQTSKSSTSTIAELWLCYGAMMCLAIAVNLPPVYLTTFSETFGGDKGLSLEQLGRIPAFVFAFFVLAILVCGPLADRWGGKLFVMLGLALTCMGLVLLGGAASYEMLLAAWVLMGLGAGMLEMVLTPLVSALQPHRRASAMNWLHAFYCIGALGTVLIGAGALHLGIPWRSVAFAMIALPAAMLAGFAGMRVPPLVQKDARRKPVSALLKHPFFLAGLAAILLGGAVEHGLAQWLPAYTERVMGFSKATGGMVLAGFLMAMIVGRMLAASAGHHMSPIRLMIFCCIALIGLFAVACFSLNAPVALSACIAIGLAGSCLWPTTLGVIGDRFPHGGASMFALLSASGNAGCFIMPWVVGIVAA
ncbi:MAG: MFS transporter, partial [Phycisphaerae bacterium]|nr:MFS transporter [Phycisphaerae bacterium]